MKDTGLHDGFLSRKWWGLLLLIGLIVLYSIFSSVTMLSTVAPYLITLYSIFCGFNVAEKMLDKGLLGTLSHKKVLVDSAAGDEDEA